MNTEERFWSHVSRAADDACWPWTASLSRDGYGTFRVQKKLWRSHRLAWTITAGDIPSGICVLHRCDNRKCCNPKHLFIGTNADNMADMVAKGRQARGERSWSHQHPDQIALALREWARLNPERLARGAAHGSHTHPERRACGERQGSAALTDDIVREIRERYASGDAGFRRLAKHYGVAKRTISLVVKRKTWRHVQ